MLRPFLLLALLLPSAVAACDSKDGSRKGRERDGGADAAAGGSSSGGGGSGGTVPSTGGVQSAGGASSTNGGDASLDDAAPGDAGGGARRDSGAVTDASADGSAPAVGSQFPTGLSLCGIAYDSTTRRVWVHQCLGAVVTSYAPDGSDPVTIDAPGENANDVDIDVVSSNLSLAGGPVPAGTLLFINGETAAAEVYAVAAAPDGGSVALVVAFGNSHVVGGAYHPGRGTLYLVQDRVPGGTVGNRIAEVDPATGAVLASFSTLPDFDVNYGDLDVCAATGNLFVVSSNESTIAELTQAGTLVRKHPLPAGVVDLSGIGIDDSTGDVWVSGTTGVVRRLVGLPCPTR